MALLSYQYSKYFFVFICLLVQIASSFIPLTSTSVIGSKIKISIDVKAKVTKWSQSDGRALELWLTLFSWSQDRTAATNFLWPNFKFRWIRLGFSIVMLEKIRILHYDVGWDQDSSLQCWTRSGFFITMLDEIRILHYDVGWDQDSSL